jgi:hypothetical protein
VPRTCTVCGHEDHLAIDKSLVAGESNRRIAARFNVTEQALRRHQMAGHVSAAMVRAAVETDVRHALDVVAQLKAINEAALTVLRDARAVHDGDLALKAIDRIYRQIELQAKLLGELDDRPTLNVLVAPEWLAVRSALLEALAPYPDARAAVSGRLVALEAGT